MWYLTVSDVLRINEAEVGQESLRDFGLLESAVLRPQQTVGGQDAYPDIHQKAGALAHSLIQNHPFTLGNKRTALVAVTVFYYMNLWGLDAPQEDAIQFTEAIASGDLDVPTIASVLKSWATPIDAPIQ